MGRAKSRVYLWGWYGCQNSGDDVLLSMMCNMINEVGAGSEMLIQVPRNSQLPPLPNGVLVKHLPGRLFKGNIALSRLLAVLGSDVLIFGGGSMMSDANKMRQSGLRLIQQICRAANWRGVRIVFAALGLGPLVTEKGAGIARAVLNMADLVEVRDRTSYELCRTLRVSSPVVQGFDPAVLIPKYYDVRLAQRDSVRRSVPTIGISLSKSSGTVAYGESQQRAKIDRMVSAIKRFSESRPLRIAAIEMCASEKHSDATLCRELMTRLEGVCEVALIPYRADPVEMMCAFKSLDGIIAERLHTSIYAYTLGVPFAIIPYHSKCTAFAKDIGLPEACLLTPDLCVEEVEKVLGLLLNGGTAWMPALPVEEAQQLANSGRHAVIDKLKALLGVSN
jgi:polysaccharide pyruvyl transferase WcaK-like protein